MASKKLKKFLAAGVAAYAGSKMLGQKKEMKEYLKTEGGDKSKINYITKKKGFKQKVMDAVNVYKNKGLRTGPGPNATSDKGGTLANSILGAQKNNKGMRYDGMEMGIGGAKYGKMIKANNGVMVEARGNKLARSKPTKIC